MLSSQWGLIDPDQIIAPYDMYLAEQPASYRRTWDMSVVEQLHARHPLTVRSVVEIHAGNAYIKALKSPLGSMGITVTKPVDVTTLGRILQWYDDANRRLALDHDTA